MIRRRDLLESAVNGIVAVGSVTARAISKSDWRVAAGVGVVIGVASTLIVVALSPPPVGIALWLALFVVLALIGFQSGPVLERRRNREAASLAVPRTVVETAGDAVIEMVVLPGGEFRMGAADDEHDDDLRAAYSDAGVDADRIPEVLAWELPQRNVWVDGFQIMATPVTVGLYGKVMASAASEPNERSNELPVVEVSWFDAVAFCNRLSDLSGLQRCYSKRFGRWWCAWRADGYRLPTEAEWEYACRAGTTTRYCSGGDISSVDRYGWHSGNSGGHTQPVAALRPNSWGVYDMHGNAWEWCWDVFGRYPKRKVRNPRGPGLGRVWVRNFARWRVVRGGSFDFPPEVLRSANRGFGYPEGRFDVLGFRCVRVPPQQLNH